MHFIGILLLMVLLYGLETVIDKEILFFNSLLLIITILFDFCE